MAEEAPWSDAKSDDAPESGMPLPAQDSGRPRGSRADHHGLDHQRPPPAPDRYNHRGKGRTVNEAIAQSAGGGLVR
eukprot:CAMPEP_0171476792 /NCGR_PEP_ID=MMETSP0946-20130122/3801_1 /TAXON_ID=109269 /ORGANISM="Vaucheria litorea, Strain CCMP2940" /LENGTH=75 /DNA_ID=CAMNT_0012007121 /DNA_START=511 /DNA_END=738 /DNA_ORIENTATION=-